MADITDAAAGGPADPVDVQGMLLADVPCRHCGYNLRGLRQDSRCPECGVPVSLAIHGDLLSYADPGWVAGLARGTTYILWGVLINLLVAVLNVGLEHLAAIPAAVTAGAALFAGLVGFYGAWLLTARDPSGIGEDPYVTARKIVRTGLLVGLVGETALVPLSAPGALPIVALVVLGATLGVSALVGIVAEIAKYTYIEKLARRIPDLRLAGRARFVRRANYVLIGGGVVLGAVLAVMVVSAGPGTLAATFAGPPPAPTAASSPSSLPSATTTTTLVAIVAVGGVGVCALGMIMLVIGVASLVLLFGLRKALQAQAELARHHWAPESVAATPAQ